MTLLTPSQQVGVTSLIEQVRDLLQDLRHVDEVEGSNERQVSLAPPRVEPDASLRVLVVDDNSANLHLIARMLGVFDVVPDTATTGPEAVRMFDAESYDLIFMDVMLPGVDGVEVTRQIRERAGDRPYVMGVSALPSARGRCLAEGMNAFAVKPLRLDDVSRAVEVCKDARAERG